MYAGTGSPDLLSVYVDDIVSAGTTNMTNASDNIARRVPSKVSQPLPFKFAGSYVKGCGKASSYIKSTTQ